MILQFEEKDYISSFLTSLILIKELKYSKKIFLILGESLDKLGFLKQSKRSLMIGLHLRPLDLDIMNKLLSYIELFESNKLDEIKYKKLMIKSNDFDLNYYFFKKFLNEKESKLAYEMINSKLSLLNHFKLISEDFLKVDEISYSILILKKGILLFPNELYYPLYELYLKKNNYFYSFKYFLHYSYFTNYNDYSLCANLLENSKLNFYALVCYYNHFKETKNETSFQKIKKLFHPIK